MRYCIGVDLGGTNIAGGIADLDGKLLLTDSIKTGLPCPASDIADRIALLCRRMATALGLALSDAAWVGIGAPGSVDVDTGTVLYANNLEFDNVPLGQMIHERTGLPVYVDNDANVAAWGEYCAGAGKGSSSMVMVTLGTGVGGGVVLNGNLLTGCNGAAAELGHFVIDMHGKECNCGMRGCFEQYGSVTALIHQAREAMAAHKESKLWALAENEEANVNGKVILGTRARKTCSKSFQAFSSVNYPDLAVVQDEHLLQYMRCACYPSPVFYDALDDKVGLLKLIPGTPAAVLEFMLDRFDGLVIESFGVGGLPEYEGDASYFDIIHRGIARGKLVVMTTQVPNEGSNLAVYHVGGRLKSALRLLEAYDMTTEAAVAKLMWIMGQTHDFDEAERLFYRPVARDILYEN